MVEAVRTALRLKSEKFDDEIKNLVKACFLDLGLGGLRDDYAEDDPLLFQAVVLYCKANFGFYDDSEKYDKMYQAMKISIANSGKYGDNGAD